MSITLPMSLDDKGRLVLTRSAVERLSRGPLKVQMDAKESVDTNGAEFPEKVVLDGTWSLNEDHDLEFKIHTYSKYFAGVTLNFKTGLISAKGNEIAFSARISDGKDGILGCAFAFQGRWQADKNNRLTFDIVRYAGTTDRIVFQGDWQVGKNNELFYTYDKRTFKRGNKDIFSFGLKGKWEFGSQCITYRVEGASNSIITFAAALQTPSILAKDGEIRYQVGVRFTTGGEEKGGLKSVAIYGTWKLGRNLKIGFEAESTAKGKSILTFTAEKVIFEGGILSVSLKTEDGEKFGAEVVFSKTFSNDAEFFIALSRFAEESKILGGVRMRY